MAYTDMWEIIDDNGTIHSGTEEEMRTAFKVMISYYAKVIADNMEITIKEADKLREKWLTEWGGDIKLIQIHEINR